jgi:hypothetical protein
MAKEIWPGLVLDFGLINISAAEWPRRMQIMFTYVDFGAQTAHMEKSLTTATAVSTDTVVTGVLSIADFFLVQRSVFNYS